MHSTSFKVNLYQKKVRRGVFPIIDSPTGSNKADIHVARGRKVVRVEDPCPRHGEGSEEVAADLVSLNPGWRGRTCRRHRQGREEAALARSGGDGQIRPHRTSGR